MILTVLAPMPRNIKHRYLGEAPGDREILVDVAEIRTLHHDVSSATHSLSFPSKVHKPSHQTELTHQTSPGQKYVHRTRHVEPIPMRRQHATNRLVLLERAGIVDFGERVNGGSDVGVFGTLEGLGASTGHAQEVAVRMVVGCQPPEAREFPPIFEARVDCEDGVDGGVEGRVVRIGGGCVVEVVVELGGMEGGAQSVERVVEGRGVGVVGTVRWALWLC